MDKGYYKPDLSEFHVGFEYEMKRGFGDGTVKSLEQYNNAEWIKQIYDLRSFPYVDRTMNGSNPNNLPSAIRVKYLDEQDILDCGWNKEEDSYFFGDYMLDRNNMGATQNIAIYCIFDDFHSCVSHGYIKNKSDLKKTMQMLNIKK